jgi:hypothetical protein
MKTTTQLTFNTWASTGHANLRLGQWSLKGSKTTNMLSGWSEEHESPAAAWAHVQMQQRLWAFEQDLRN